MKNWKCALALLLCLCLLSGCAALPMVPLPPETPAAEETDTPAPEKTPEKTPEPQESPAPEAVPAGKYFADTEHAALHYADMEYVHYDDTAFRENIESAYALMEESGAWEELAEIYSECSAMLTEMLTHNSLIYLQYYHDVSDEAAFEEAAWSDNLCNDAWDALCSMLRLLAESRYGEDFRALVGDEAYGEYLDYEDMTEREKELYERESELELLYEQQLLDSYEVVVDGEVWTAERFAQEEDALDYETYFEVYFALEKAMNDVVGATFTELVAIRRELAEIYGVESYAHYAYEEIYARDYTPEEIASFREVVKTEIAPRAFEAIFYSDLFFADTGEADYTAEELLDILRTYLPDVSEEMLEPLDYMTKYGLYDIGNEENMSDGAFTTTLTAYQAPFIYARTYGDCYDVSTVVHEFGHYNDAYHNIPADVLLSSGCFDLLEIHSTGLEVLFHEYYGEIFGAELEDAALMNSLGNLLWGVVSGCIYDEFQQYVYSHPGLTLEEINQAYYEINASYGYPYGIDLPDGDTEWMYVSHNFSSPMYYISYATSAVCALELWAESCTDRAAAVDRYLTLVSYGAYDYGFTELTELCGFDGIGDAEHIIEVCDMVLDEMERMERVYAKTGKAA